MFWDGTWRDKAAPVVAEIWNIWNIFQQHSQHALVTVPLFSYKFEILRQKVQRQSSSSRS